MKEIRTPVRERLSAPLSGAEVERLWDRIEERRALPRPVAKAPWVALACAAAAVVLVSAGFVAGRAMPAAGAPLELAAGGEIGDLEVRAGEQARSVALSDGSTLALSPGARIEPLESSGSRFAVVQRRGRIEYHLKKGGPQRWAVECGSVTVEVAGTHFLIDRGEQMVHVEVLEGSAIVRGETIGDRVHRLGAGQAIDVRQMPAGAEIAAAPYKVGKPRDVVPPAAASSGAAATAPAASSGPRGDREPPDAGTGSLRAAQAGDPVRARPPRAAAWRDLARMGEHGTAYRALGPKAFVEEASRADVDDLLLLSDVARLSGHPAEAIDPLSRVVAKHADEGRAALASFTLGKLRLDALGQPAAAAGDFVEALSLGLSSSLVEEAKARIVEARSRAQDVAGARAAAAEYERSFPNGRYLAAVRGWAGVE
ncbi:hypothetical protein A7982_13702 [Minicystis rosea]|nr:hypothetical protein A7982_13702 [Minicystis rosea]